MKKTPREEEQSNENYSSESEEIEEVGNNRLMADS